MTHILKHKTYLQFIGFLILLLVVREYAKTQLIAINEASYINDMLLGIGFNIVLIVVSLLYIKRERLLELAGLSKKKPQKTWLLIFPLVYLSGLNMLGLDAINQNNLVINLLLLITYCFSIGYSEELSIRGFLQSYLIKHSENNKKNAVKAVLISGVIFGVLHLLKFDKGLYGELGQVFFATFIGVCFGALLLITKRLYPLIIVHAIIDFVAKMDAMGTPLKLKVDNPQTLEEALFLVILVAPVFIYGLVLLKKNTIIKLETK
jgi:membrane protease YdiL (CAAX protease family)